MKRHKTNPGPESGVMLLETLMAAAILLICLVGVLSLLLVAATENQTHGQDMTRTAMYAQDKMDQLMALSFNDASTNVTVYPPTTGGSCPPGCGLGGTMAASTTVGSTTTPTSGYVDYLDSTGAPLSSSTGAFYERMWSITTDSTGTYKTLTVLALSLVSKTQGPQPQTTLVCVMSN